MMPAMPKRAKDDAEETPVEPEAPTGTVAVLEDDITDTSLLGKPLVIDLAVQSTRPDGKPLPLPTPADPALAFYAVKCEDKPDSVKSEGWQPSALIPVRPTPLSDPRSETDRIYPSVQPGYKYDEELFQSPAKNVVVKTSQGLKTKLEALAANLPHSSALQVKRRAWRPIESSDVYLFEDPMAAAAQPAKHRPVVDVTLWCPVLTAQHPRKPHGPYLGVGETSGRGGRPGTGRCAQCNNDGLRAEAAEKVALYQKGLVIGV